MVRYLTKSRFKLAMECPTKLFYTGKSEKYKNIKGENEFLEFKERINDRLNAGDDVPWTTLDQAILDCDELFATAGTRNAAISKIKKYLQQIRIQ